VKEDLDMLKSKIALITGASQGIGFETGQLFVNNGANVIGVDCVCDNGERDSIDFYKLDVSKTNDCEELYTQIITKYGYIDILVNCAGITRDALTRKMTEKQWDSVIDVNLKGTWNMTRLIGPAMQNRKSGSIINISSVVGVYGNIGQANYAATKAGVIGLTKTWAKEFSSYGGNVRVNAIAPGYTMTNMMSTVPEKLLEKFRGQTMFGRLAEPIEIANVALFLASDMSSYVTGAVINVDGGMRL